MDPIKVRQRVASINLDIDAYKVSGVFVWLTMMSLITLQLLVSYQCNPETSTSKLLQL